MKLTKKQIETIKANTPEELKGLQVYLWDTLGYYQKTGANWSYVVGYTTYKGVMLPVVTMFGEVL